MGTMLMIQINPIILNKLLTQLKDVKIIYVGLIGSRFWKESHEYSDWDFIAIIESDVDLFTSWKQDNLNIHYWGFTNFKTALAYSNPLAWEWLNYSQEVLGKKPDLNYLVDTYALFKKLEYNIKKEFGDKNLTAKQLKWKNRYLKFISKLNIH